MDLFGNEPKPEEEKKKEGPYKKLIISFANFQDYKEFAELIGQPLYRGTSEIEHPYKLKKDGFIS